MCEEAQVIDYGTLRWRTRSGKTSLGHHNFLNFLPMLTPTFHCFPQPANLDRALANFVTESLRESLTTLGTASLVVSGGRTPAGFFDELSQTCLDWSRITITLADERRVGEDSPHSNAASVRTHLLQGHAAAARFLPLYLPGEGVAAANIRLAEFPTQFDVVVLGMGDDGHTASIFPDSPQRDAALFDASRHPLLAVEGKAPVTARLTLTAARLLATRRLIVHITGESKWQVLGRALTAPTPLLPISHFLHSREVDRHVFWA
jgi:6-phosphogluconolactonase